MSSSSGYIPWPEPADEPAAPSKASAAPEDAHFLAHHARDPHLLLHKALYFSSCAAIAAYIPYLVQWMRGVGLTPLEAGGVFAAAQGVSIFAAPLLARLADASAAWRRGVLVAALLAQMAALQAMARCTSFAAITACYIVAEAAIIAIFPILDASIQRLLIAVHGDANRYGNTRAWGAAGWGVFGWVFGALYDAQGGHARMFDFFALAALPCLPLALALPLERRSASAASDRAAWSALLRWDVAAFALVLMACSLLLTALDLFRFSYLETLGASNELMGLSLLAASLSETPFFFLTHAILERVSVGRAMVVVALGYAARFLWYMALTDARLTVPAELLHGVTFALGWAAATKYIGELLPPELASTGQGLMTSVIWGMGGMAGSLFGGGMVANFGWRAMWLAGALVGLAAAGVMMLSLFLRKAGGGGAAGAAAVAG